MKMKCKKGFTLIEMIVSFAVVGIVVLMLFSVFDYNLSAFNKNTEAMNEQSNLRLVSYKLSNQLRNIGYIDLDNDKNSPSVSTDSYIYVENDQLKLGNTGGTSLLADDIISDVEFSLSKNHADKYSLGITVFGKVHSYSTEILLNNIVVIGQVDSEDLGKTGFNFIQFNSSKPPLTIPGKIVGEPKPLSLITPDEVNNSADLPFIYTARATGGSDPYDYEIYDIVINGGNYDLTGDTLTWYDCVKKDSIEFTVKVTDASNEVFEMRFVVEF